MKLLKGCSGAYFPVEGSIALRFRHVSRVSGARPPDSLQIELVIIITLIFRSVEAVKLCLQRRFMHSFCSVMRRNRRGCCFALTCKITGSSRGKSNMTVARMRIKLGIKKVILFS